LPFVRELLAELEHTEAFERVRRHLSAGSGRRRVSGLTATARALYLPYFVRAGQTPVLIVVSDNKAAEALQAAVLEACDLTGALEGFTAFVVSLAHTAAVHFGDIPDPVSGEQGEPNLPAAQQMIEILSLLEVKTRGNLTAEERQVLDQLLYELRMRYIEVSKPKSRIITP